MVIRNLRPIVHKSDDCARFLIIHQDFHNRADPDVLLASGTESDVNAAKTAAMKTEARIEYILTDRLKLRIRLTFANTHLRVRRVDKSMASRFHILIVEDEPLIVEILQETLEAQFHVSSVSTVAGALALLRISHVDVALVDSVLPDGHGDEIADYARAHGTSVIGMSGYPHEMHDFESIGHPHLMKPFGTEALFSTIAKVLEETAH